MILLLTSVKSLLTLYIHTVKKLMYSMMTAGLELSLGARDLRTSALTALSSAYSTALRQDFVQA